MQQTVQILIDSVPSTESDELATLLKMWPQTDAELQQLVEDNLGELLGLLTTRHSTL